MRFTLIVLILITWFAAGILTVRALDILDRHFAEDSV